MASGLEDDIRSCLDALGASSATTATASRTAASAGDGSNGSSSSGKAGAPAVTGYPTAWLLLDLQQLLPAGHSLACKLQGDEAQFCKQLEAAERSPHKASRLAAAMLQAIGSDTDSARQLAKLLCQNSDMLQLCLQAFQADGDGRQMPEAVGGIGRAAWQVFSQHAAALEGAGCVDTAAAGKGEAAVAATNSLHIATQLSAASGSLAEHALLQHGSTLACFFLTASQAAARLPEGSKAVLSDCLAWWADAASGLAYERRWSQGDQHAGPCLDIAGVYLATALQRMAAAELSYKLAPTSKGPSLRGL
ncbi:hypothetical protein ABPG75_009320 [Micractinium tetrahymenae]